VVIWESWTTAALFKQKKKCDTPSNKNIVSSSCSQDVDAAKVDSLLETLFIIAVRPATGEHRIFA